MVNMTFYLPLKTEQIPRISLHSWVTPVCPHCSQPPSLPYSLQHLYLEALVSRLSLTWCSKPKRKLVPEQRDVTVPVGLGYDFNPLTSTGDVARGSIFSNFFFWSGVEGTTSGWAQGFCAEGSPLGGQEWNPGVFSTLLSPSERCPQILVM